MQDDGQMTDDNEVLMTVRTAPIRRWIGIGLLFILGMLVLYIALTAPPDTVLLRMFLIVLGLAAIWCGDKMRRATELALELTRTELRDSSGMVLARLDQVVAIDRGAFAFKPSNGFTLKLSSPGPRGWRPGLWWRIGKRVGIGGVVAAAQAKIMAETIQGMTQAFRE